MKIALLETIEALVSAIKSKFLTKTEAESIYQPKASAINTSNIGSQSVSYASSAYSANKAYKADEADEAYGLYGGAAIPSGNSFPPNGTYSMKYFLAKGSETDITGLPPVNASVIHMGAYIDSSCDHQLALGNDGELYTRYIRNSAWQSWTRMAKASEIPDVSGFATEDWVTYSLQERDENINNKLDNYLLKTGGTITGSLTTNGSLKVNGRLNLRESGYIDASNDGSVEINTNGIGLYLDSDLILAEGVVLTFNPDTNTLEIRGGSGQNVHLAVNGNVIA